MQQEYQLDRTVLEHFAVLKNRGRLAHAYLFAGPSDIGKGETALAIAKLLNCESAETDLFCDVCPSCVKINSGNHPDILLIDNEYGESIKIDQVREVLTRNKLRSFMGGWKIFILRNIEFLTLEAANVFLKTLEEPASNSLLLLTTSVPEKILGTIKSRCHTIHFQPMSFERLTGRLAEDCGVSGDDARLLTYFAQGCLRTAKRLDADQFIERKNALIDEYIFSRPDDKTIKAVLDEKEETKELVGIFLSWIRDAILVKAGVEDERLVHADRKGDLKRFAGKFTFEDLQSINASVVNMCQLMAENLNIKIPLLIIGEQIWGK